MKTLTALTALVAIQLLSFGSAFAGTVGPAEVELAGTFTKITVTGTSAADLKSVIKPLSKAAICGLLDVSPGKHVLVSLTNKIILVNKNTGATVATFMTYGDGFQTGNNSKGIIAYQVQFFGDVDSIGSYLANFKYSGANDFFILTGKFQGGTENPPVIVGGGAPSGLFFKGKVVFVKPYTGPLL